MHLSFSTQNFSRHKKLDMWFAIVGGVLLVFTIWMFVWSIRFLVNTVDVALDNQTENKPSVQFRLDALPGLGITVTENNNAHTSGGTSTTQTQP